MLLSACMNNITREKWTEATFIFKEKEQLFPANSKFNTFLCNWIGFIFLPQWIILSSHFHPGNAGKINSDNVRKSYLVRFNAHFCQSRLEKHFGWFSHHLSLNITGVLGNRTKIILLLSKQNFESMPDLHTLLAS